ncbi:MAG: hypothetical protein ACR2KL_03605 [Nocardioidaceae bacterium]
MPAQTSWWWLPWVVLLSGGCGAAAWHAWHTGRRAVAVRRMGWATLPWAAWLLGLVTVVWRVGSALGDWLTRFVLNPAAWLGVALALVGVSLVAVGTVAARRGIGETVSQRPRRALRSKAKPVAKDATGDFAEVEDILNRRGIR